MLTESQVNQFITEKLTIPNWRSKVEDKLNFLNEIVRAFVCKLCYQNLTWGALPVSDRKTPSIEEVIHHGLNTPGGACLHLNYFIKLVLDQLGYDAFMVSGASTLLPKIPSNHPVIIVRFQPSSIGNEDEQLYMVDVGFGRPIYEAIPLHKLPYTGEAGGFKFEFRFNPDQQIYERYLHLGCPIKGKFEAGVEGKVEYFFDLKPLKFDDVHDSMEIMFTDASASFFLNTVFLFRFIEIKSSQDFRYVCFRGKSMAEGTVNDRKETSFQTYKEMLPAIVKSFPHLNKDVIEKALFNYESKV